MEEASWEWHPYKSLGPLMFGGMWSQLLGHPECTSHWRGQEFVVSHQDSYCYRWQYLSICRSNSWQLMFKFHVFSLRPSHKWLWHIPATIWKPLPLVGHCHAFASLKRLLLKGWWKTKKTCQVGGGNRLLPKQVSVSSSLRRKVVEISESTSKNDCRMRYLTTKACISSTMMDNLGNIDQCADNICLIYLLNDVIVVPPDS